MKPMHRAATPEPTSSVPSITASTGSFPMPSNHSHMTTSNFNTAAWISFTYIQFASALGMAALGICLAPVDLTVKGYLAMALLFSVGATFTLAKTVRDEHEAKRITNRLDDARAEKLLMEVGRAG
jgi:hypothetical protein